MYKITLHFNFIPPPSTIKLTEIEKKAKHLYSEYQSS